jgi:hypothetical protein
MVPWSLLSGVFHHKILCVFQTFYKIKIVWTWTFESGGMLHRADWQILIFNDVSKDSGDFRLHRYALLFLGLLDLENKDITILRIFVN